MAAEDGKGEPGDPGDPGDPLESHVEVPNAPTQILPPGRGEDDTVDLAPDHTDVNDGLPTKFRPPSDFGIDDPLLEGDDINLPTRFRPPSDFSNAEISGGGFRPPSAFEIPAEGLVGGDGEQVVDEAGDSIDGVVGFKALGPINHLNEDNLPLPGVLTQLPKLRVTSGVKDEHDPVLLAEMMAKRAKEELRKQLLAEADKEVAEMRKAKEKQEIELGHSKMYPPRATVGQAFLRSQKTIPTRKIELHEKPNPLQDAIEPVRDFVADRSAIEVKKKLPSPRKPDVQSFRQTQFVFEFKKEDYAADVPVPEHSASDSVFQLMLAAYRGHLPTVLELLDIEPWLVFARQKNGHTALRVAAAKGYLGLVKTLLERGSDVNGRDKWGRTPLHAAIFKGHDSVVKLLIANGAQINIRDVTASTPLHVAVQRGHPKIVNILLNKGAQINLKDNHDRTVLEEVARMKETERVEEADRMEQALLKAEAKLKRQRVTSSIDVDAIPPSARLNDDKSPYTPKLGKKRKSAENMLQSSQRFKTEEIAEQERKDSPFLSVTFKNPQLAGAVEDSKSKEDESGDIVSRLDKSFSLASINSADERKNELPEVREEEDDKGKDDGVDVEPEPEPEPEVPLPGDDIIAQQAKILWRYIRENNFNSLKDLVAECSAKGHFKKVSEFRGVGGWMSMHWCAHLGRPSIMRQLIGAEVDINSQTPLGCTSLYLAAGGNRLDVVRTLISEGADLNMPTKKDNTPLFVAVSRGHLKAAELLVDNGADFLISNRYSFNPLMCACFKNRLEIAEMLLQKGATVTATNVYGWSVLHWACNEGKLDFARRFIDMGCNVNQPDAESWTPLHFASMKNHIEIVTLLLREGASPDILNTIGQSPLHIGAKKGFFGVVSAVSQYNAKLNVRDSLGCTPAHYSARLYDTMTLRLLIEKGADIHMRDENGISLLDFAQKQHVPLEVVDAIRNSKQDVHSQARKNCEKHGTGVPVHLCIKCKMEAEKKLSEGLEGARQARQSSFSVSSGSALDAGQDVPVVNRGPTGSRRRSSIGSHSINIDSIMEAVPEQV